MSNDTVSPEQSPVSPAASIPSVAPQAPAAVAASPPVAPAPTPPAVASPAPPVHQAAPVPAPAPAPEPVAKKKVRSPPIGVSVGVRTELVGGQLVPMPKDEQLVLPWMAPPGIQ